MQNNKPKWLRRLEKESWQAELIISGVAIFGSLQLPGLMDGLIDVSLTLFPEQVYVGLYMMFIYFIMATYALIISLIIHFVVRAMWIGLIGLNSVFPNGINVEHKTYGPHFMKQILNEFPNDASHITNLDHFCSVIFAFCSFLVMTFIAFTINILILLFLYILIADFLPENVIMVIVSVFILVILIMSFLIMFMNHKNVKERPFVKKYQYLLYTLMSKVTFHVFRKAIVRLSFTFFSNLDLKKYFLWIISFTLVLSIIVIVQVRDSKLLLLTSKDNFYRTYDRTDRMLPENYLNTRKPEHGRVLSAVLDSDVISGEVMKVFVPVFSNEDAKMEQFCGKFNNPDNLKGDEKRRANREFYSECLKKYHQFYLNDKLIEVDISKYTHENKNEEGMLAYIKTEGLQEGLNVLRIEKLKKQNEVYRTMNLPFYFQK